MSLITRTIASITLLGSVVCGPAATAQVYFGKANAIDGDTIDFGGQRIRLFGIDAVEANQNCERNGEAWNCGQDATAALRGILEGRSLQCERRDVDRYGRVVAVCLAGGHDLSQAMVQMGLAVALPEFSQDYVDFERNARSRGIGIWAGDFQMPSEFRKSDPDSIKRTQDMLAEKQAQDRAYAAEAERASRAPRAGASYRNCAEARAAGATPLYRGEPGYGAHMDGDGDGVACEPYRGRR